MPTAWRIVKKKFESSAFDGEGARLYGGRWNSIGNRLIYAASSQSLAALEILVHVSRPSLLQTYVALSIEIPNDFIETADPGKLPKNWLASPPPTKLQKIGDKWVRSGSSVVLAVPSAVIPGEVNFLLNPTHADFAKLLVRKPVMFEFDKRLAAD